MEALNQPTSSYSSSLEVALRNLQRITVILRAIGLVSGLATFIGLICFFLLRFVGLTMLAAIIPAITSLLTIIVHDDLRRRGRVIYSELADELHWQRDNESSASDGSHERIDLSGRITISSFVQSTDVPLFAGRVGYLAYAAIDLAVLIGLYFRFRL